MTSLSRIKCLIIGHEWETCMDIMIPNSFCGNKYVWPWYDRHIEEVCQKCWSYKNRKWGVW